MLYNTVMIKTKRIETTRLAQLGERRSAEREAVGSNPGRTNTALRDKVKRDDPNESSAVYLLTSDDKYAVVEQISLQINFFAGNF